MIKSFFSKWFNKSEKSVEVPRAFKSKKKSIFLNRYAGLLYFLITWHTFGYLIISSTKDKAAKEGNYYILWILWILINYAFESGKVFCVVCSSDTCKYIYFFTWAIFDTEHKKPYHVDFVLNLECHVVKFHLTMFFGFEH